MPDSNTIDKAKEIISALREFSSFYEISGLFVAGEYCRSLALGRTQDPIYNMDVLCAYGEQSKLLAELFSSEVLQQTVRHIGDLSVIELDSIKINFQGKSLHAYMSNQELQTWMQSNLIENIPLVNNLYGRDFTLNTLIYAIESDKMLDPLNIAIADIESKLIRAVLPVEMAVKYNPIIVLRALRFSVQYDFFIEKNLKLNIESGLLLLGDVLTRERIAKEIVKILKINPEKGLQLIQEYELSRFLIDRDVLENVQGVQ